MTHTDGLIERTPRIGGNGYPEYAHRERRISIDRGYFFWWVTDYRAPDSLNCESHPTFAAAWEHADTLTGRNQI